MKTKIILTIAMAFVIVAGMTFVVAGEIKDVKDKVFKDKVKKIDVKKICDKEKEIKEWKDKKILFIKVGEYQELRCEEDYLDKDWYKSLDEELIKEDKTLGLVRIKND